jgi:hypothetical protein
VILEAGDGSLWTDRPACSAFTADSVQFEFVGRLPAHGLAAFVVADVRAIRADSSEVAVSTLAGCRAITSRLLFSKMPRHAEII